MSASPKRHRHLLYIHVSLPWKEEVRMGTDTDRHHYGYCQALLQVRVQAPVPTDPQVE